jgi:5-methylcytosine-specific restriction endonuclease McrA
MRQCLTRCQLRLKPCLEIADTVDHVIPRCRGGQDIPTNLQAACAPCNALKGDRVLA